jgi:hypothetical protein
MYQILCGHVNNELGKKGMQVEINKKTLYFGFMFILIFWKFTRNDDTTSFCYKSYNNIGCDDEEEEVDSDDMEYTEDAIDNMILEFSGD